MIEQIETNTSVAAILISPYNEFILQEREDIEGILNPGMWSFFGGSVKKNETNWAALKRELFEELELIYKGAQVEVYKTLKIPSDKVEEEGRIVHFYIIKNVDTRKLVLHEGKSIIIDRLDSILENTDKLTPITQQILLEYKQQNK